MSIVRQIVVAISAFLFALPSTQAFVEVQWDGESGTVEFKEDISFSITKSGDVGVIAFTDGFDAPDVELSLSPGEIPYTLNGGSLLNYEGPVLVTSLGAATGDFEAGIAFITLYDPSSVQNGDTVLVKSGIWDLEFWTGSPEPFSLNYTGAVYLSDQEGWILSSAGAIPEPSTGVMAFAGALAAGLLLRKKLRPQS